MADRGGLMPEARLSKEEANYRHNERCSTCDHFISSGHCEVVAGNISPEMVCDKYEVRSLHPQGKDRSYYEEEYNKSKKV